MSLSPENIYEAAANQHPTASRVLAAQNRYFSVLQQSEARDPRTGDLYPVALYRILAAMEQVSEPVYPDVCDRFADIFAFAADSVQRVMKHPRSTILRNVEMTPIQKASRLNAASIVWLNRQPGDTKKQKLLSCRHGIPAIQRHFSLDTGENRLLKRFVKDVFDILCAKESAFGSQLNEREEDLLFKCNQWLREEDVQEIQHQRSTSINNAILGDADYNRIWRASNRLAVLEEAILSDCNNLLPIETCQAFWCTVCLLKNDFGVDFPQQACHWDEEKLLLHAGAPDSQSISGLLENKKISIIWDAHENTPGSISIIINGKVLKSIRVSSFSPEDIMAELLSVFPRKAAPAPQMRQVYTGATLLDFCSATPWYACAQSQQLIPLPFSLLQQYVSYLSPDNTQEYLPLNHTRSTCALFEKHDIWLSVYRLLDPEYPDLHKDAYASYVASLLRKELNPVDDFVYLLPDDADEFSLRRLNAAMSQQFEKSLPLPTSVATVLGYATQHKCSIGTVVFVIEKHSDSITITPMEAEKPSKAVYVPGKLVWVRHPAHLLPLSHQQTDKPMGLTSLSSSEASKWMSDLMGVISSVPPKNELQNKLKDLRELPVFADKTDFRTIEARIPEMLVQGAGIYRDFTLKTRDIKQATIWRHHLPPLFAQFEDNNYLVNNLPLVGDKTTINPREQHFHIPIADNFVLKAGRKNYSFPLKKGTGADSSKYEMYLHSPMFPLTEDETCSLELFYTYGAAEPYEMYFISADDSWRVKVEWREFKRSQELGDVPEAPAVWDIQRFKHYITRKGKSINLLTQLESDWATVADLKDLNSYTGSKGWLRCCLISLEQKYNGETLMIFNDSYGNPYVFWLSSYEKCQQEFGWDKISKSQVIYVQAANYNPTFANYAIRRLIPEKQAIQLYDEEITFFVKRASILDKLWNGGRCCHCGIPDELASKLSILTNSAKEVLSSPKQKNNIIPFLAYYLRMGQDAPAYAVSLLQNDILPQLQEQDTYTKPERHLFLAIGDGSCTWQQELFNTLMTTFQKRTVKHRFWILSRVLWRDAKAINLITGNHLNTIVSNMATKQPNHVLLKGASKHDVYIDPWYASVLEIMLALLRLRGSADPKLRKLVSLNSRAVNQMYRVFQNIVQKLVNENAFAKFYTHLDISLPSQVAREVNVPPLIYLVRCYLTGEHTPAGITIEERSEEDPD